MECNKEEAIRARDIAETKFKARDFAGSKRFALKALSLNPSLEGISQMMAVIDVHMVSQQVIGDRETDWYGILHVDPEASEAAIKSQYKKLALLLHPDKNKAPGAESAFKLLSDAWKILSDKSKKFIHDSKRKGHRASNVRSYVDQSKPDAMARNEETERLRRDTMARMKAAEESKMKLERKVQTEKEQEKNRKENEMKRRNEEKEKKKREREQKKERDKEMTKMKKIKEMEKNKKAKFVIRDETDVDSDCEESDTFHDKGGQFSRASGGSHEGVKYGAAQRGARPQQGTHENRLRTDKVESRHQPEAKNPEVSEREDNHTAKRNKNWDEVDPPELEEASARQRRKMESLDPEKEQKFEEQDDGDNQFPVLISKEVLKPEVTTAELPYDPSGLQAVRERPSGSENLPAIIPEEIVKASLDQAIGGLRENEFAHEEDLRYGGNFPFSVAHGMTEQNRPNEKEEKSKRTRRILKDTQRKHLEDSFEISTRMTRSKLLDKEKKVFGKEERKGRSLSHDDARVDPKRRYSNDSGLDRADVDTEAIEVLPSQFHDFDILRTAFRAGQIWAVYDDKDGMPRFYCRLTRVSRSSSPFKAKFVWLEPTAETEEKNPNSWLKGNRFAIACGEFEAGEEAVTEHVNIFSHCVFENLRDDPLVIYPLKAEIWAIYSDWGQKLRGKQEAPAEGQGVEQSYELVEILEDFSEEKGVVTVRLVKTPGFCAVFHRQEGSGAMLHFSPSQLPAFSHHILSGKVPTEINLGVSVQAWELSPAALPPSMILSPASSH